MDSVRLDILRRVERGTLSAEEALRLLDALGGPRRSLVVHLRVTDLSSGRETTNLVVPAEVLQAARKLGVPWSDMLGLPIDVDLGALADTLETSDSGPVVEETDEERQLRVEICVERG
jgi:hypothetical protein